MTDFSNLIKKINEFYKGAASSYLKSLAAPPTGYYMPDDPNEPDETDEEADETGLGLYSKIIEAARQIENVDISSEVQLIAELYKKALQQGSGFTYVNRAVSNIVNLLDDEDNEEQAAVEDLMNEVSRDLRNRAKAAPPDNETSLRALQQVKNEFNDRMISQEMESEVTPYEAGLAGEVVFDPTGGVSPEVGKTKGRGYRFEHRTYKDWVQSFEDERDRILHELEAPELLLSRTGLEARRNTATRSNMNELVGVLNKLIELKRFENRLETDLQVAPNPNEEAKLEEVRQEIRNAQTRRNVLKKNLRFHQYEQENQTLKEELPGASAQQKLLLDAKIRLNDLMLSPDRGKDEEAKWLRVLINSISLGHGIPPEQLQRFEERIQAGAQKRKKATDLWRQRAEQVAALKGTIGPVRERQVGESGTFGKRNKYNWNVLPLDGLVSHLTQRLATERIVVKQKVTDKLKKAQKDPTSLKPFMDDVAKAATKKDKAGLLAASNRLRDKMEEFKNVQPELVQYVISLRTSKFFYNFRDRVKLIGSWVGNPLSGEQVSFIDDTIREGKKLAEYYKNLKVKPITPGWAERTTHYKAPIEVIEKIVENLEEIKYG